MSAPIPAPVKTDELHCHTADLTTHCEDGDDIVVTVAGEIDAANAERFATYTLARATPAHHLTVDLARLEFFGVAGFSALHTVKLYCAARGVRWTLVVGPAVARVLRLCDPVGALPVSVATRRPASLQLVPQPGQGSGQKPRHMHL